MEYIVKSIGTVKSPVIEGVDSNWGEVVSEIILDSKFTKGLKGLEEFSHAVIIFYMHKSTFNIETDLQRRPQGRDDMPLRGTFSQRAKHRPNPIGITTVKVLSVQENILLVQGLDAVDGTPVLDIKPYFPPFDMKKEAKAPEWVDILMEKYF
jgi:tRNA-Thr(GGU) m(6)t(6)A37 methyltransferase TsaA